jgi:hypothetical protein
MCHLSLYENASAFNYLLRRGLPLSEASSWHKEDYVFCNTKSPTSNTDGSFLYLLLLLWLIMYTIHGIWYLCSVLLCSNVVTNLEFTSSSLCGLSVMRPGCRQFFVLAFACILHMSKARSVWQCLHSTRDGPFLTSSKALYISTSALVNSSSYL